MFCTLIEIKVALQPLPSLHYGLIQNRADYLIIQYIKKWNEDGISHTIYILVFCKILKNFVPNIDDTFNLVRSQEKCNVSIIDYFY